MCKKRQDLLAYLFKGFTLAAGAGMAAWAILSWAVVQISKHACEGFCAD